jgi:hypothetical protein
MVQDRDSPLAGTQYTEYQLYGSGLTGPVRAKKTEYLAAGDLYIETIQGEGGGMTFFVGVKKIFGGYGCTHIQNYRS